MAKSLILHGGLPHVIWASDGFQFACPSTGTVRDHFPRADFSGD
jgi:hypothetical protein